MNFRVIFHGPLFILLKGVVFVIQVCIVCDRVYGEKEPLELRTYTHGLCLDCLDKRLRLKEEDSLERGDGFGIEGGDSGEALLP